MERFTGFPEGKTHLVPVPAPFFEKLLLQMDTLAELKLILYFFWRLDQQEGAFRYLKLSDLTGDKELMLSLSAAEGEALSLLNQALNSTVLRGSLLEVKADSQGKETPLYFLNSAKGRMAVRAIESGQWHFEEDRTPPGISGEPANIFRLYEENIGAITPLLAETLSEAEDTYPGQWIEDAIRIAIEKNKRNWRYVEAILKRWQQEGRDGKKDQPQNRRDSEEDRRSYIEGEYSDFIEH